MTVLTAMIYCLVATASVLLWIPTYLRFFRQWRERGNPVSLALCVAILLIMWWAVAGIWIVTGKADTTLVIYTTAGASILTSLNVHLAFHRSKKMFPDQRKKNSAPWRSAQ